MKDFYKLQISLLQNILLCDLAPKALLRQGRNVLNMLKKSKQILRQDEQNKHWLAVKQICLVQIEQLPSIINIHLMELSPEEDQILISFSELVSACAIVLYEEAQLDTAMQDFAHELKLTEQQIKALQSIDI